MKIATVDRYKGHEAGHIYTDITLDLVIIDNSGFTAVGGRMKTAVTRAKMSLYVIASVALLRFKSVKAIFDHWVSKGYSPSC